ncbi:MAG: terminase family protein [Clostridia bacterium]|nr:terminase family protein [Clostridia bacterium]
MKDAQIIENVLKIEREQRLRDEGALKNYNRFVVHEKQMAFHKCQRRNRWVFGGNRSGKTECGAVESVWMALGIHPFRQNRNDVFGWVVSLTQQVQRDVAQAKILKYLSPRHIVDIIMREGKKSSPEYGIIDHIVVRNSFGGISKIGFKSCDQGREKFQGASLDFVWFDEEPPKDVYDECKMRVFDRAGDIFGTMTPLKGLTWVYDEIELNSLNSDEVWCEYMEWNDNPYLDRREIDYMTSIMSHDEQESRRFGKFFSGEGLVYPEFDQNIHVVEPFKVPKDWYSNISIDPGLSNPTSCHFYAVDFDGTIYVIAEHYAAGKSIDYHVEKIFDIARRLDWQTDSKGRLFALIDSAANQRTLSGEKSVAELFSEKGILVNTNVNKDLYSGIQRIKSLLCQNPPRIYIFKTCTNLIREIKSYWWGKNDRPKKVDDHALDELRYFVMTQPRPPIPASEPKSEIALDKEKLLRSVVRQNKWMNKL